MTEEAILLMCRSLLEIPLNNDEFRKRLPIQSLFALENAHETVCEDYLKAKHHAT
ncbi:hypothetical protein QVA66_03785 [Staphylococcus chromogenes]|nr:hypothetical protein [Staphylococcus chromogenes]